MAIDGLMTVITIQWLWGSDKEKHLGYLYIFRKHIPYEMGSQETTQSLPTIWWHMATDFLYHRVWFDISQMCWKICQQKCPNKITQYCIPGPWSMWSLWVWYGMVAYFVSAKFKCCLYREVFVNQGTPKWMVYSGKSYDNWWLGGTLISRNRYMV